MSLPKIGYGRGDDLPPEERGYHVRRIEKGEIGETSKIREELEELMDAELQGVRIMQLVEASDMLGAIVRWLERHHPDTTLVDLIMMHEVTRRAFENGKRKSEPKMPPNPCMNCGKQAGPYHCSHCGAT